MEQLPPPSYEEALETTVRLVGGASGGLGSTPLLSRLRRSLTDRGEAFRSGRSRSRSSWSATPSWSVLGDVPETQPATPAATPRRCSETLPACINMETSL